MTLPDINVWLAAAWADQRTRVLVVADGAAPVADGRLVMVRPSEAPAGELCALFGSTDHLEIAINAGDAAGMLGLGRGSKVTVRPM